MCVFVGIVVVNVFVCVSMVTVLSMMVSCLICVWSRFPRKLRGNHERRCYFYPFKPNDGIPIYRMFIWLVQFSGKGLGYRSGVERPIIKTSTSCCLENETEVGYSQYGPTDTLREDRPTPLPKSTFLSHKIVIILATWSHWESKKPRPK